MRKLLILFGLLIATGGCVAPPSVSPSTISRYQRSMAGPAETRRMGREGLDLLRPAPSPYAPQYKIEYTRDPDTGQVTGTVVRLSLNEAIRIALSNSLDIAITSYDPGVTREQMIEAAAEFDVSVFGGYTYDSRDEQTASTLQGSQAETRVWQAGFEQKTVTGATWTASWTLTRTWDNSPFSTMRTRYEPVLELEIAQPLLRDAWPEFNLASVRLARVNHRISMARFRQQVEEVVTKVIETYWELLRARREVQIQENLLAETIDTLRRTQARGDLDATAVQIRQTEAAVADRRASLIRTRKQAEDVQDALVRLLSDEQLNLVGELELIPTTEPVDEKIRYVAKDQLLTALQYNAQLEQAREGIAAADIQVLVAENRQLPRLDLTVSGSLQGLAGNPHEAHENMGTADFVGYSMGIQFEYPLGNRALRSRVRQRRLERWQAITDLQNTADLIAEQVIERIRQVQTTYGELEAQREAAAAARDQLQALKDTEELRGRLTPEFLQVKLAAQESIARAESQAAQALASYNQAMVELAQVTGTVLELNQVKLALSAATGGAD